MSVKPAANSGVGEETIEFLVHGNFNESEWFEG